MPLMNGLDTAREVLRRDPKVRVVILTMNEDPDIAAEAFRVGVSGYLLKRSAGAELIRAVREVMNQRYYLTPLLTKDLVGTPGPGSTCSKAAPSTDAAPARSPAAAR